MWVWAGSVGFTRPPTWASKQARAQTRALDECLCMPLRLLLISSHFQPLSSFDLKNYIFIYVYSNYKTNLSLCEPVKQGKKMTQGSIQSPPPSPSTSMPWRNPPRPSPCFYKHKKADLLLALYQNRIILHTLFRNLYLSLGNWHCNTDIPTSLWLHVFLVSLYAFL